jgi:hypothetical protein
MFPPSGWRGRIGGVSRHPPIRLTVCLRSGYFFFLIFGFQPTML